MAEEKIILISCDGKKFKVDKSVALELQIVKSSINNDDNAGEGIQIPKVTGDILAKIIEYCNKHVHDATISSIDDKELKKWDVDFIKMDKDTLLGMVNAAKYLDMSGLTELACQAIADTIKDFSVEELRYYFNIENDFTAEEEAQIRKESNLDIEDDFTAEEEAQILEENNRGFLKKKCRIE